ncbi:MAG: hypothetical protein LBH46_00180 [Rickettsiales bacterium]|jgi:uracil permease|nr:hypothetical protein [Rickettsiales bacterium]
MSLINFVLGIQILIVALGSLVIGPILTNFSISMSLLIGGVCTLLYHFLTKKKLPYFLGGNLIFIASANYIVSTYGMGAFLNASFICSFLFILIGVLLLKVDKNFIDRFLPAPIKASVVVLIGFSLCGVATSKMVSFDTAFSWIAFLVSFVTIGVLFYFSNFKKKAQNVAVILAILIGYTLVLIMSPSSIDFAPVRNASWFSLPWAGGISTNTSFNLNAVIIMMPLFLTEAGHHIASFFLMSDLKNENLSDSLGFSRPYISFGITNIVSSFLGGLPVIEYGEVNGVIATTKKTDVITSDIAAVLAILLSFCGKLSAFFALIPLPVMGGIMFVLFGGIGMIGVKSLFAAKIEEPKNLILSSVILASGLGNLSVSFSGGLKLDGIGLAVILGIITNLLLKLKKD